MAEFSMLPWETQTGTGDGASSYNQDQANNFFRYFDVQNPASEGIVKGVLSELAVSGAASPLTVAPGAAICYGRYWNTANVNLAVTTPAVGTTGGRVVLRTSWATNQTRLAIKTSADGNPALPSLTQVAGTTWEITIATFTITTGGVITVTLPSTRFRKATAMTGAGELSDGAVTASKIASDSVDDTKLGNRVPQFYRRQGTDATTWYVTPVDDGSIDNYTPGPVRMQAGVHITQATGMRAVTFPVAFSAVPIVIVTPLNPPDLEPVFCFVSNVSTSGFTFTAYAFNLDAKDDVEFSWLAMGPE